MTETVLPLRKLVDMKKYKGANRIERTEDTIEAFEYCRDIVFNCQELYFLEDTSVPIIQTDASDYGIGSYLYMVCQRERVLWYILRSTTIGRASRQ